jgi:hypothetical protein
MTGTQPFPDGAKTAPGACQGAFCQGAPAVVVRVLLGETYRTARLMDGLCADCLADFAVVNQAIPGDVNVHAVTVDPATGVASVVELPHLRVWAEAEDGLFHEVTGDVPHG